VKILAIRFARFGDVVLMLPALCRLKNLFPNAHLTFLTGHRCAPIAEMCPAIDTVISVNRIALRDGPVLDSLRKITRLIRDVRQKKFDLVIDLHGFRETNLLTWLSGAPKRIAMKRAGAPYLKFCFNTPPVLEDKGIHVTEMFMRVVSALSDERSECEGDSPKPLRNDFLPDSRQSLHLSSKVLAVPGDAEEWQQRAMPQGSRMALYVDAPVPERIWPAEYFAQIADFAVEKLGARVAVISGSEGRLADRVRSASRFGAELSVFTQVSVSQLVALIASSQLLVSNDTGPMHLGPVVGVRTIGLFSVGYPEHFRPTGSNDRFLRANPIEKIKVESVIEAIKKTWTTADPDSRC
jgi:ADP-heptose:LPS heptosyltransferase